MRPLLLSLLLLPSLCQAQLSQPEVTRQRGFTTLVFSGQLTAHAGQGLTARLRRGEATALASPAAIGPDGACLITIRTPRLLLDGSYVLELVAADAVVSSHPFQLGDPAGAQSAASRMSSWYRGAAATFRALTASLERRGAWHCAVAKADPERQAEQEERYGEVFLPGWERALRQARMDLATYQRRLVLPPRPELGAALLRLVGLLRARAKAWAKALEPFGPEPGPNTEVEAVASELLAALPRLGVLESWRAGPLGTPEPALVPGAEHSSELFGLTVPPDAEVNRLTSPAERGSLSFAGVTARILVDERPAATDTAALRQSVEVAAWETWESYKRLRSEELERGLRLEFLATTQGRAVRVIQRSLFPKRGGRVVSLLIFLEPNAELPAAAKELEGTFRVP